jgi:hypothetical protein
MSASNARKHAFDTPRVMRTAGAFVRRLRRACAHTPALSRGRAESETENGSDQPSVSSAFWKRPACDFSAFANVSNHSAMSAKPSSRAAFAIDGYISLYS